MRLLLVDDDKILSDSLQTSLMRAGFAVDTADNGIDGEHLGHVEPYDIIVLDLGLPQRSGLEVLRHWRSEKITTPVIILTARDAWHEKVEGFKAGTDDYLAKPFHVEELIARINALVRRANKVVEHQLSVDGIQLNDDTQTVQIEQGNILELTGTEFRLLRYFMLNKGKILSRTVLYEHVYDYDSEKDSNVIDVYIKRLRKKLGKERIQTRRGQGYVFTSRNS